ncbi:MAG: hypothetical protein ABI392_03435 [Candidatus Saccharimonadales bacterium]
MSNIKPYIFKLIGIIGAVYVIESFIRDPNFPTPDILIVLATFVFMIFGQAKEMLKHLLPFVVLLLGYDSFRSLVPGLNSRVEYVWMIHADKWLFGSLPKMAISTNSTNFQPSLVRSGHSGLSVALQ